jgi:hypothetical protein
VKNTTFSLEFESLPVDYVFVYAGLRVVFERRERVVPEPGKVQACACSSLREQEAEEGRGAVGGGLTTKGRFGHPADCASVS